MAGASVVAMGVSAATGDIMAVGSFTVVGEAVLVGLWTIGSGVGFFLSPKGQHLKPKRTDLTPESFYYVLLSLIPSE
jgi:hypothetical protein